MLRQMQSGGNKALSFGKSRAKLLNNQQKRVTFKDVAGVEEAKEELQEIIEIPQERRSFKSSAAYSQGRPDDGPAGNGQDTARPRYRRRSKRSLLSISGSDFVEMFVGVGARAYAICSNRARRMRPASSSSTRSMQSVGTAARVSAVAMTSASKL